MIDVAFVSPPSRMINHYRPPMALIYLAGYLRHQGMSVGIIDVPMSKVVRDASFYTDIDAQMAAIEQKMLDDFRTLDPKIIGITFYTPEYFEVFQLARAFKKIKPSVKVVVGGIHPSFYPEEIFAEADLPIDFAVLGDGEETMAVLSRALLDGKTDFSTIPGLAFNDQKGRFTRTAVRELGHDLDAISFPAYDMVDMDYYSNASPYAIRGCFLRTTYLMATRGCPSSCTFCVGKKLREFNCGKNIVRSRSAESLVAEIIDLKSRWAIDGFYFIDDLFTLDKENVRRFCRLLREKNISVLWGCSAKVTTLNEETIRAMAEAGCIQIDFGVERGSDAALKAIKKGITIGTIKNIFSLCHRYGIRTFANILVNVPGETAQDLEDILVLLDQLQSEIVSINPFCPYPGTEIYDHAGFRFEKSDYPKLINFAPFLKTDPGRFKFSVHDIDIIEWTLHHQKRFNKVLPNLAIYFRPRYWLTILRSKRKSNYLSQLRLLVREFINQKF